MAEIEGAGEVRDEDAFDVDAVAAWLREQGTDIGGPVEVRQFGGGASNLTYSLRTPTSDLILRRPPTGRKAKGAHDMGREYRIQAALEEPFGLVADMVATMYAADGVGPLEDRDVGDAPLAQRPRRAEPAEAGADDHDAGSPGVCHAPNLGRVG